MKNDVPSWRVQLLLSMFVGKCANTSSVPSPSSALSFITLWIIYVFLYLLVCLFVFFFVEHLKEINDSGWQPFHLINGTGTRTGTGTVSSQFQPQLLPQFV